MSRFPERWEMNPNFEVENPGIFSNRLQKVSMDSAFLPASRDPYLASVGRVNCFTREPTEGGKPTARADGCGGPRLSPLRMARSEISNLRSGARQSTRFDNRKEKATWCVVGQALDSGRRSHFQEKREQIL
jgi:hypothetical protein